MSSVPTIVAGADVTRGRWVVVVLADGRFRDVLVVDRLAELDDRAGSVEILALDIPIGLPTGGRGWPRQCDLLTRELVGPRRFSVFYAPPRPVFDAASFDAANAHHRELTGKGLSRQTWALRAKILEAESFVTDHPATIEAHPESCFCAMKGAPLELAKKSWNGQMERRALLESKGIAIPEALDPITGRTPPDDLLDAAATAWTAWRALRGRAEALPSAAGLRDRGVIWR
jgi:predicted RNase H-like nuclease